MAPAPQPQPECSLLISDDPSHDIKDAVLQRLVRLGFRRAAVVDAVISRKRNAPSTTYYLTLARLGRSVAPPQPIDGAPSAAAAATSYSGGAAGAGNNNNPCAVVSAGREGRPSCGTAGGVTSSGGGGGGGGRASSGVGRGAGSAAVAAASPPVLRVPVRPHSATLQQQPRVLPAAPTSTAAETLAPTLPVLGTLTSGGGHQQAGSGNLLFRPANRRHITTGTALPPNAAAATAAAYSAPSAAAAAAGEAGAAAAAASAAAGCGVGARRARPGSSSTAGAGGGGITGGGRLRLVGGSGTGAISGHHHHLPYTTGAAPTPVVAPSSAAATVSPGRAMFIVPRSSATVLDEMRYAPLSATTGNAAATSSTTGGNPLGSEKRGDGGAGAQGTGDTTARSSASAATTSRASTAGEAPSAAADAHAALAAAATPLLFRTARPQSAVSSCPLLLSTQPTTTATTTASDAAAAAATTTSTSTAVATTVTVGMAEGGSAAGHKTNEGVAGGGGGRGVDGGAGICWGTINLHHDASTVPVILRGGTATRALPSTTHTAVAASTPLPNVAATPAAASSHTTTAMAAATTTTTITTTTTTTNRVAAHRRLSGGPGTHLSSLCSVATEELGEEDERVGEGGGAPLQPGRRKTPGVFVATPTHRTAPIPAFPTTAIAAAPRTRPSSAYITSGVPVVKSPAAAGGALTSLLTSQPAGRRASGVPHVSPYAATPAMMPVGGGGRYYVPVGVAAPPTGAMVIAKKARPASAAAMGPTPLVQAQARRFPVA